MILTKIEIFRNCDQNLNISKFPKKSQFIENFERTRIVSKISPESKFFEILQ